MVNLWALFFGTFIFTEILHSNGLNNTTEAEDDILLHSNINASATAESNVFNNTIDEEEDIQYNIRIFPDLPGMNFAADDSDGKRLFRDLFTNYLPAERPVVEQNQTINVLFEAVLIKVLSVQEAKESVLLRFWIRMYWTDYLLHWNPEDYGGRQFINVPAESIWVPDIVIYNNLHMVHHVKQENLYVKVNHDGAAQYFYPTIVESSCEINIKYFPVDTQNCSIKWGSWSFHGFALNLDKRKEKPDLGYYELNNEFDLEDAEIIRHNIEYTCCPEPYPDVTMHLILKRRPLFYIITLILPTCTITLVAMVGIFAPSHADGERREKMEMSLNALLALTLMIMSMSDMIPPSSNAVPLLGVFYIGQFAIITVAICTAIFIINLEKQGHYNWRAPRWMVKVFIETLPVFLGMRLSFKKLKQWQDLQYDTVPKEYGKNFFDRPKNLLTKVMDQDVTRMTVGLYLGAEGMRVMNEINEYNIHKQQKFWIKREWDRICDCIDRLMMLAYVLTLSFGFWIAYMSF